MSMTADEVRAHVARYTYKPGWEITVDDAFTEGRAMVLRVTAVVPNAYRPEQDTEFGTFSTVHLAVATPERLDAQVSDLLVMMEVHESTEFLQRDGRPVFDPHLGGPFAPSGVPGGWEERVRAELERHTRQAERHARAKQAAHASPEELRSRDAGRRYADQAAAYARGRLHRPGGDEPQAYLFDTGTELHEFIEKWVRGDTDA